MGILRSMVHVFFYTSSRKSSVIYIIYESSQLMLNLLGITDFTDGNSGGLRSLDLQICRHAADMQRESMFGVKSAPYWEANSGSLQLSSTSLESPSTLPVKLR